MPASKSHAAARLAQVLFDVAAFSAVIGGRGFSSGITSLGTKPALAAEVSLLLILAVPVSTASVTSEPFSVEAPAARRAARPPLLQKPCASWTCEDELRCPIRGRSPNYSAAGFLGCAGELDCGPPRLPAPSSR